MKVFKQLLILTMAGCLCASGAAYAQEAGASAPAAEQEASEVSVPDKTLGKVQEDALQFRLTNNTGKDIVYFSVMPHDPEKKADDIVFRVQEALIRAGYLNDKADGNAGPKTQAAIADYRKANHLPEGEGFDEEFLTSLLSEGCDGNLLEKEDVFKAGETRILYIEKPEEISKEETDKEKNASQENDVIAGVMKEFSVEPEYIVTFRTEGQDNDNVLCLFRAGEIKDAVLYLNEEAAYIEYTTQDNEEPVSTLEIEQAIRAALIRAVEQETAVEYAAADYGYEPYDSYDSYDSYDNGYEEPAYPEYEEPVFEEPAAPVGDAPEDVPYDAPYIVTEEYYPSCDDGSHGVIYRVWSDGTEERIDY